MIYSVIRKNDGAEVYRYMSDSPIEWGGFEFSTHDHIAQADHVVTEPSYSGSWRITKLAFRNRFSPAEKATIEIASQHNPSATQPQQAMAASLRASLADQRDADYIDLKREDTRSGVNALQSAGIIGAGRAAVILDTPPTEIEVFHG